MTAKELREKYLNFFKSKGHAVLPSASLIPENDPTSLFIGSGMQPLIPYLLGEKHPRGQRLANSQKSFRAEDIEEVGDSRHTTFFEMLGNWSLGDYFKKEQLSWMWEFLLEELKLDPKKVYVTVYRGNKETGIERDKESVEIWKKLFKGKGIEAKDVDFAEKNGMRDGRIFYYDDNKNWWSRSGVPANMPVGEPGGPDSEMFYDLGANLKKHENSKFKDLPCHVNCDCGRFIEIGNNVFMEFVKTNKGFEPLPQKNVDFGGGLERMTMVSEGKNNVFETDLFVNILRKISQISGGKKYQGNAAAFEIIADHIKAATFIMADDKGIAPSNTDQGYIVRRLIRRAVRYGRQLGIKNDLWIKEITQVVIDDYKDVYPELERNKDFVLSNLDEEETRFKKTLEKGLKEFEKREISGREAFNLYQTYGFPIEMTKELAEEKGIQVDEEEFQQELKKHQELSRTASAGKFKGGLADAGEETKKLHTAAHLLLAALRKVLNDSVTQKGSNITAERLRFDFSWPEKLTDEQKKQVEDLVNEVIKKDLPVVCEEMSLDEAKKQGAAGVFESKYGERVKVYTVGNDKEVFSQEICGGPHIERTGELGHFKISKEESSSAGVRRIKAMLE
ncbi:MAG: alanine--tRNA ligase [Candidatus Portnoybacteria bacterium CG10_big_fil_rev_8_21_14_0_10_43_39]|uniref:Alanine--tRNA ligase n=1 Tax=Candidatus Portnoybacteria bacterium CG10_big_fil_rev_8_21_14_0_10_43_39 TaxID=1974815 RepID=A0A2M8KGJ5_9BACT|nr:MAG: alanine--tRNA ligase [Candidatus Portnoybacteria bacterium CG10_big_fil_rev_8_21_14_0_10_43_39]